MLRRKKWLFIALVVVLAVGGGAALYVKISADREVEDHRVVCDSAKKTLADFLETLDKSCEVNGDCVGVIKDCNLPPVAINKNNISNKAVKPKMDALIKDAMQHCAASSATAVTCDANWFAAFQGMCDKHTCVMVTY